MTVFEWLSVIGISLAGLWAVGTSLISLAAKHKERAESAERKSLTDSVETVRDLAREVRSETMNSLKTLMTRVENIATDLFSKFYSADKTLAKHEAELERIMEKAADQQREFSKEFDRLWKAVDDGRSQVKELAEGYRRITDHRKKTD